MRRGLLLIPLLAVLAHPFAAKAQTPGTWDFQAQGSILIANSEHGGNAGVFLLRPGWFLTSHHEIGLNITGNLIGSKLSGNVGPFYSYNFPETGDAGLVPYLVGGFSAPVGDSNQDLGDIVTFGPGFRFPLGPRDSFAVSAETDYSLKTKKFSDQVRIQLGFSHFIDKH